VLTDLKKVCWELESFCSITVCSLLCIVHVSKVCLCLFRLPDKYCRRTYILPRILSFFPSSYSFFLRRFPSSLNGTQKPKSATRSKVTAIWKRMSKIWGIPSAYKSGTKTNLFGRLRNLTAKLTAYIFGTKHDIDNRSTARWQPKGVSYTSFRNVMNFSPLTASNWTVTRTHKVHA